MPWIKIDEAFYDHPKWDNAPGDSIALWVAAIGWCNRNESTTGYIPALKLSGLVNIRNPKATVKDLCDREAFHAIDGGYLIHDYEEFQQTDRVKKIADQRRAAGKKGAAARWAKRIPTRMANAIPPPIANAMANRPRGECPDSETDSGLTSSTQETDDLLPVAEQSSSVDLAIRIAARAAYDQDPGKANGSIPRYIAGIERNIRAERHSEILIPIAAGQDPIHVAGVLIGSQSAARHAARTLGIPIPGEPP